MENREIKFRAWNTDHDPNSFDFFNLMDIQNGNMLGEKCLDEMPIMQFTSLKDKNGVDIYEGDLLADIKLYRVIFMNGQWILCAVNELFQCPLYSISNKLKIIGNIY